MKPYFSGDNYRALRYWTYIIIGFVMVLVSAYFNNYWAFLWVSWVSILWEVMYGRDE